MAALGGCSRGLGQQSPGEVAATPFSQLRGTANPAECVVAIVANRRGEILLSRVERPANWAAPFGSESPSAGENALPWKVCEKVLTDSGMNFITLFDVLYSLFDVMYTGNWHGEDGQQLAQVYWHMTVKDDLNNSKTLRGLDDPYEMFALKWAAAWAKRQGEESALETAHRAVLQCLGPPADRLEEEYSWFNPQNNTAYFRFLYTGSKSDRFVIADPDQSKRRAYRRDESWGTPKNPAVRLVSSYLHVVEEVPTEQILKLFRGE